jgi:hypothetical protein
MVHVDARYGIAGRCVERLISVVAVDQYAKFQGQLLFVDTCGTLRIWGLRSRRQGIPEAVAGREEEMKRFLIARALRDWSEA